MRLDHVSYVTSHDQLADTVQRLGSRLGSTFVDGGIHPRFGTRNFTLPLQGGHYIEVVCPLDHPASDSSAFGKAVSLRAQEGGGWLTWVVSVDDVAPIETRLGRPAVDGHRVKPDGSDIRWKQIGVLGTLEDRQLPFFIQWIENHHPSTDGKASAKIVKVEISGNEKTIAEWLGSDAAAAIGDGVEVIWVDPAANDGETGIVAVHLETPGGVVRLD
ncbi:MAG: VOC family protein [Actinobacteria bacterium]|nr:VOC family protein [Actinomycetota bacterium]MSW47416.1 VOC family protein [Actinomycetota bacterium]MSX24727.1 VOC family protein [Actinomycetota bacterium]MSY45909.1 VOC family protein [Actinomycetota bacterium]MSY56865.1 VOC family protein [Actinomycetota bacterium]